MRVLITGASGLLGDALTPALAAAGHHVRLLDFRPTGSVGEAVLGDIRDPDAVRAAVDGVDAVVHLAALHGVHLPHWSLDEFWTTNVVGTRVLYDACRDQGIGHVVLASTMGVYGVSGGPAGSPWSYIDDDTVTGPRRYYGMTKLLCEELAAYHARAHGINTVALRLGMFFPPPTFPRYGFRLLHGGVDVRDVVRSIQLSLAHRPERGFDTFNVFSDVPFRPADTVRLGADLATALERYWPGVTEDVRARNLDLERLVTGTAVWRCDKAKDRLGYSPDHNFAEFLAAWRSGEDDCHQAPEGPRWGVPGDDRAEPNRAP